MKTTIEYWVFHNYYMSDENFNSLEAAKARFNELKEQGYKDVILEKRTREIIEKAI